VLKESNVNFLKQFCENKRGYWPKIQQKDIGVDFTNVFARIFRAHFSYERLFSCYVLQKTRAKTVGEIDPRRNLLRFLKNFSNVNVTKSLNPS